MKTTPASRGSTRSFRQSVERSQTRYLRRFMFIGIVAAMSTVSTSVAFGQETEASAEAALACFEQSRRDGEVFSACPPGVLSAEAIVRVRGEFPAATYEAVLSGLEQLALMSDDSKTRAGAVIVLAGLGDSRSKEPLADTVDRLRRIYEQSNDMPVRALIARLMCCQVATGQAIEFLKLVAKDNRQEDRSATWPPAHWALTALEIMGPEGRAALQSLHAEGNVENARARGYLEYLSKNSFREPR